MKATPEAIQTPILFRPALQSSTTLSRAQNLCKHIGDRCPHLFSDTLQPLQLRVLHQILLPGHTNSFIVLSRRLGHVHDAPIFWHFWHQFFGIFPFRCFVWIVLESWLISLVLCEGGGFFFALFSSSHKHLFPFNYGFLLINNIHSTPLDSTLISDPDLARPAKFNLMPFVPNYNFYKLIDGRQAGRINIHGFTDFMFGSGSFSSNYV